MERNSLLIEVFHQKKKKIKKNSQFYKLARKICMLHFSYIKQIPSKHYTFFFSLVGFRAFHGGVGWGIPYHVWKWDIINGSQKLLQKHSEAEYVAGSKIH